jgi:hypothetical protein
MDEALQERRAGKQPVRGSKLQCSLRVRKGFSARLGDGGGMFRDGASGESMVGAARARLGLASVSVYGLDAVG